MTSIQVNNVMNRLKIYIFDNPIMIIIRMTPVLQHIDDSNLICCFGLIKYVLPSESSTYSKRCNETKKNQLSY